MSGQVRRYNPGGSYLGRVPFRMLPWHMKLRQMATWGRRYGFGRGAGGAAVAAAAAQHYLNRSGKRSMSKRSRSYAPSHSRRQYRRVGDYRFRPTRNFRSVVRKDGLSYRVRTAGAKRRSRKSLSKKVNTLIRNQPKYSTKTYRHFKTMAMPHADDNQHRIHAINVLKPSMLESYLQTLTLVDSSGVADYRANDVNSSVKIDFFYKITIRNNSLANCDIKYVFMMCNDAQANGPLHWLELDLQDRGYTGVPSATGVSLANVNASEIPDRMIFSDTGPFHAPTMSGVSLDKHWSRQGKVKSLTLGPGDSINIYYKKKNLVYKPEVNDKSTVAYQKGNSVFLMVDTRGQLGHDDAKNDIVGYGRVHLDAEQQIVATVKYYNPKGLNEVAYTDTLDNTNITLITHADNISGAIEGGEK